MKKKVVFLTGAGMSVESGFKTFRGNDGLWENYPVEQIASHEGWERDPTLVTEFYNKLRRKLWDAQPCEGHKLIAGMEKDYDVTVLTQNVDNLHEKAGSTKVIHLHGELTKVCSSNDPYDPRYIQELTGELTKVCSSNDPYDPRYIQELTPENSDVASGTKAGDGSLLRPFIVFFGESVPMLEPAAKEASEADIFVIIGTSLVVYPAAGLVQFVPKGAPIYLIDPNPVNAGGNVIQIQKGASEGMKELLTHTF